MKNGNRLKATALQINKMVKVIRQITKNKLDFSILPCIFKVLYYLL